MLAFVGMSLDGACRRAAAGTRRAALDAEGTTRIGPPDPAPQAQELLSTPLRRSSNGATAEAPLLPGSRRATVAT